MESSSTREREAKPKTTLGDFEQHFIVFWASLYRSATGVFMSRKGGRGKEKEWRKRAEEEKLGGRESRRSKDEGKKDGEEGIKESRE